MKQAPPEPATSYCCHGVTGSLWSGGAARLVCMLVLGVAVAAGIGGCAATTGAGSSDWTDQSAERIDSLTLLRAAGDHEALYTLVGGLKPMSTGIWRGSFAVEDPDLAELRAARLALAPFRNDIWHADIQVFESIHEGERSVHAFVVHRAALARMIDRFECFWSPWGITPCTHPSEVIAVVDRMPRADRWRGYGYLFGYPADAVDFFVEAGLAAGDGREVGLDNDRRFVHIPTYIAETGRFTYAVALDHVLTPGDRAIAFAAERILAAYQERKEGRMRDIRSMILELRRLNDEFESSAIMAAEVRDTHHTKEGFRDAVLDTR